MKNADRVFELLAHAKQIAQEYRTLTGKPLGVTGEIAEYEAAKILNLELMDARQPGYDAIEKRNGTHRRLQIKSRCLLEGCNPGQRLGSIQIEKEFDAVVLVLLDNNLDAYEIYEADREPVIEAITAPGSKARNEKRSLPLSKFKSIGRAPLETRLASQSRGTL
jgi:hypothetical protein